MRTYSKRLTVSIACLLFAVCPVIVEALQSSNVMGSKSEKELLLYASVTLPKAQAVATAFEKKYPPFKKLKFIEPLRNNS